MRLFFFGFLFVLAACGSSGPIFEDDIADPPVLYTNGDIDPFRGRVPQDRSILYATEREPATDRPYGDTSAGILRVGRASMRLGLPDLSTADLIQFTLQENRPRVLPVRVIGVEEFGPLQASRHPAADPALFAGDALAVDRRFADAVNARIAAAPGDDIVIYIHGAQSDFQNPLLVASEMRHFSGYANTFIGYAWPAGTSLFDYLDDTEEASVGAFQLRRFIKYLASETNARRIHLVAYSAGTRMVTEALGQYGLEFKSASAARIRQTLKLGQVVLISSDADPKRLGAYLIDGADRIPEQLTLYQSTRDLALNLSSFLFRGSGRLGQSSRTPLPPHIQTFLRSYPNLTLIDVTDAERSNTANGHRYLRESPWVASDLIASLTFGLSAEARGLVPSTDLTRWVFPADYPDRVRRAVLDARPDLRRSIN